ncbi:MAG: ribonuclease P protein component [Acidimicrobiales bacterium]
MSSSPRDLRTDTGRDEPVEVSRLAGSAAADAGKQIRLERIHNRSTFLALRRSRRRSGSGVVRVHYDTAPPGDVARRVAYSVPRRVGKATERNRCRRRLREVAREVVSELPPGAYLIGVEAGAGSISFEELRRVVVGAMRRASRAGEQ